MQRATPRISIVVALLLGGCTAPAATEASSPATPSSAPSVAPTSTPPPSASATPTPAFTPPPAGVSDTPLLIQGVPVVSKTYRLSSSYVPPWANQDYGLHEDVRAAFATLQAAAKADGLTLTIRSGYRSYAAQKASFDHAMKKYSEETARRYYAEAGASEHQTGLSLDAWDGRNRGSAFAATDEAAWLAAHAHEYGFIIRYPQGKTDITGYAWESWHLRWVGTAISSHFTPGSNLTLEEYLGLA